LFSHLFDVALDQNELLYHNVELSPLMACESNFGSSLSLTSKSNS